MGDVTPDPNELWAGIGGNFDSITQVICEFVDNSLSNFRANSPSLRTVWITADEDISKGTVTFSIEDTGTGVDDFDVAMKLGEKSGGTTQLNEHGFGLKHALATANPTNDSWLIYTKTESDVKAAECRLVGFPYTFTITPSIEPIADWPGIATGTGTYVLFECERDLFDTVQSGIKGSAAFAKCLEYLAEDLGFIYASPITDAEINIQLNGTPIPAVQPKIVGHYPPTKKGPTTFKADLGGGNIDLVAEFCEIDDSGYAKYYRKSTRCSGLEIRINGRMIESNIFTEVWGIDTHNLYNHILVMVDLQTQDQSRLPVTRTSKNGFRRGDAKLASLFNLIQSSYPEPSKKPSDATSEGDLVELLRQSKDKAIRHPLKTVKSNFGVWKHVPKPQRPKVDLYVFDGSNISIYEAKRDNAGPQSVYQLLMYWDGIVDDTGFSPVVGILIASDHSPVNNGIITMLNGLQDANGNNYNLVQETWLTNGIAYP